MAAFWAPLAVMWVLMSVEGPLIAAVIARLPRPEENLAAFQLTFSLALLVESPVIMLLTAATALAATAQRYRLLFRFTALLAVGLTILHLVVAVSPLFGLIVQRVIGAPPRIVPLARAGFLWMLVWSGAIAFRRLWQGVLIRHDQTVEVAITTIARLAVTGGVCLTGLKLARMPGASVGGLALSAGVLSAAGAAWLLSRNTIRQLSATSEEGASGPAAGPLGWGSLLHFYMPLALTSFILLGSGPIFSFGLGRARDPIGALAVWPVVTGLLFVFRSGGYAYQEVVVALLPRPGAGKALERFAWLLAGVLTGLFGLFAITPMGEVWLRRVAGLSPGLAAAGLLPLALAIPVPALSVFVSWLRGRLVHVDATRSVTLAVAVNLVTLTVALMLGIRTYGETVAGAELAAGALSLSMAAECAALWWLCRQASPTGRDASRLSMVDPLAAG